MLNWPLIVLSHKVEKVKRISDSGYGWSRSHNHKSSKQVAWNVLVTTLKGILDVNDLGKSEPEAITGDAGRKDAVDVDAYAEAVGELNDWHVPSSKFEEDEGTELFSRSFGPSLHHHPTLSYVLTRHVQICNSAK